MHGRAEALRGGANPLGWWPLRRVRVRGPSMAPTLSAGDTIIVVRFPRPASGQIVLVRWSSRPGLLSVKRAVRTDGAGWYVLGDNPVASTDSAELGPAEVVGVAWCRLWPHPSRLRSASTSGSAP